ncbi:MAG: hydrogen gas-evolving membrane-bound hydrogenase subunit E [Bacilli bacterium]|nr:hydrogen gas-evolving membrane-bound hydrogenase subunit E [Bacilli bacterium]
MSKKVSEDKYKKTFSYRFKQWFYGTADPFVDKVEMKPQKEFKESDEIKQERKKERDQMMLDVYDMKHNFGLQLFNKSYKVFSVIFCIVLVCMLLVAVSYLPTFGNAANPVNNGVAQRYIERGLQETGAVNIVTGMILDYRAFDTLGESHVLFIATCTVLILLRNDKKIDDDRFYEPKSDVILQTVAKVLVPPIIIFGIYVILAGHLGPGGGFSGGAIIGAGLILYLNAFDYKKIRRFFNEKTYKVLSVCALACYSLSKTYSFYTGANHIESIISLGTPGALMSSGLILILNICVGVVVAGTMYTFYVMFRRGGY